MRKSYKVGIMDPTPFARQPIFIHSLFRSASTYFFHKFRGLGNSFTCYQEPFNETLNVINDPARQGELLATADYEALRHPQLDLPYFHEFWTIRAQLQGLFRPSFSYEHYFLADERQLPSEQRQYVAALIENAAGRPVLQFCRSAGRVIALREAFPGLHIHLWREPRAQWWSYKIAEYFDNVSQRIYDARHLPTALRKLADHVGIGHGKSRHLDAHDNYTMFYGLWLDAWLRLQANTHLSVGIDCSACSNSERELLSTQLREQAGCSLDFSDLKARGMMFTDDEDAFYREVEQYVHDVFIRTGHCSLQRLDQAQQAAQLARHSHHAVEHDAKAEANLRQAALAMMDRLAELDRASWRHRIGDQARARIRDYGRACASRWAALRFVPRRFRDSTS